MERRKNILVIVSLAVSLLFSSAALAAPAPPAVSVIPSDSIVARGDTFSVDIEIDPAGMEVFAGEFKLDFNPAILQATSTQFTVGDCFGGGAPNSLPIVNSIDNNAGLGMYGETKLSLPGVNVTCTLASVEFTVNSSAPYGSYPLGLFDVILSDTVPQPIEGVIVNNGTVTVQRPPTYVNITAPTEGETLTTHTVTVNYAESGNLADVDHADLQLDGGAVVHDTDNDGNYEFTGVANGAHTLTVWLVDASENMIPGATDTVNFTVNVPPTAVAITQPAEGDTITGDTVNVHYALSGDLSNVDHTDLQLDGGAVVHDTDNDGNYVFTGVPFGAHTLVATAVDASENPLATDTVNFTTEPIRHFPKLNVTPQHRDVHPGDVINISIDLNPDTKEIYAAEVWMNFNTTVLEVLSITPGGVLSQDGATTLTPVPPSYDNILGTIEYAESRAGVTTGITNPGVLFYINFKIKNAPRGSIGEIDLASATLVDPSLNSITPIGLNNGDVLIPLNDPPVAIASTNHTANNAGAKVFLDGSASYDPDGIITKYEWDFDDGYTGTGAMVTHIFDHYKWNGTAYQPYNVVLVVTDSDFATNSTVIQITPWMQGDTNGDGKVDIFDLALMGLSWNTNYGDADYNDGADLNNDNTINIIDLSILGLNWGKTATIYP
jgi:hypothetical protein